MKEAPTPFTADQIRGGCPEGRSVTTRMIDEAGAVTYWKSTFTDCDEGGSVILNEQVTESGESIGGAESFRSTWDELRRHAAFPESATTISRELVSTPLGRLQCLRYEVEVPGAVRMLWFALDLPGMPVRTARASDGEVFVDSEIVADTTVG